MTARVTRTTTAPRGLPPRPRRPRQRRRHSRRRRKSSVVSAQDVREAAAGLAGGAVRTPLRYVEPLNAYLKLESLQPSGAFKLRGAYNAIRRLPQAARRKGVITYSSGNHGQALAYAAQLVGVRAVVVMPETAPAVKVAGVRSEEHTSELQSRLHLVCRLLLEKKKINHAYSERTLEKHHIQR